MDVEPELSASALLDARDRRMRRSLAGQLDGFRGTALLIDGHDAFTAVMHVLPEKVLLLFGGDGSELSTPPPVGTLVDCWIGGLPTARFCRIELFAASGNTTIPFEFPTAEFASTMLLLPMMPTPKSTAGPV